MCGPRCGTHAGSWASTVLAFLIGACVWPDFEALLAGAPFTAEPSARASIETTAVQSVADSAADFVEIRAQINFVYARSSPRDRTYNVRCVVGRNTWLLEDDFITSTHHTYWFDGSHLVEETVAAEPGSGKGLGKEPARANGPDAAERFIRRDDSADGNPGQPPRVSDRMELTGRIAWLAFCSSPCLSREGHKLYPPSDFWKEYVNGSDFLEKTTRFEDELGLPDRVLLFANEEQPLLEYRVLLTTNAMGWIFPAEFTAVQYAPSGTKGWVVDFVVKGKVTSIGAGKEPRIEPPHSAKSPPREPPLNGASQQKKPKNTNGQSHSGRLPNADVKLSFRMANGGLTVAAEPPSVRRQVRLPPFYPATR